MTANALVAEAQQRKLSKTRLGEKRPNKPETRLTYRQVLCVTCGKPVGQKWQMPAVKVGHNRYKHSRCPR